MAGKETGWKPDDRGPCYLAERKQSTSLGCLIVCAAAQLLGYIP